MLSWTKRKDEHMQKIFRFCLLIIFISVFGCRGGKAASPSPDSKETYGKAIFFSLPDLEGEVINLEDLIGKKIILLDFSTTNCPFCSKIIPDLNNLHETNKAKIIAVYLGGRSASLKSFTQKHGIKYTVLIDTEAYLAREYGIIGVPTLLVLDLEGKIRYSGHSLEEAKQTINQLIEK